MAYMKSKKTVLGKDGDLEVLRKALDAASTAEIDLDNSSSNNLDELEGDFEGDGVEDLTMLEEETRQVVVEMLDSMEVQMIVPNLISQHITNCNLQRTHNLQVNFGISVEWKSLSLKRLAHPCL